jgi:hypothetical protein
MQHHRVHMSPILNTSVHANTTHTPSHPTSRRTCEHTTIAQADAELRQSLLTPRAPPPRVLGTRTWRHGLPQYNLNHEALERALRRDEATGESGVACVCCGDRCVLRR